MHPSVEEQLSGAQRLLAGVAADPVLSAASRESLTNVRRLLTQVSRSWAALLPFYLEDNRRLTGLLAVSASPDGGGTAETSSGLAAAEDMNVEAAAERNAALRQRLSELIRGFSDDARSDALRPAILDYLMARVDADPS